MIGIVKPIRLICNANLLKADRHYARMSKDKEALPAVARNIRALIEREGLSVNAWSQKYKLTQSTINRIVIGKMDPSVGTLNSIAAALADKGQHYEGWHFMVDGFDPGNPPVLLEPSAAERRLYASFKTSVREAAAVYRDEGRPEERWHTPQVMPKRRAGDQ